MQLRDKKFKRKSAEDSRWQAYKAMYLNISTIKVSGPFLQELSGSTFAEESDEKYAEEMIEKINNENMRLLKINKKKRIKKTSDKKPLEKQIL